MTLFSRIAALLFFSPLLLAQVSTQSALPATVPVQTNLTRAAAPDRALAIALMRDLSTNRAQYRSDMRPMYHRLEYRGLWVSSAKGNINAAGVEALATLASARQWGLLNSYRSGLGNISAQRHYTAPQLAQLELKITNAVLRLLADLANGQLDQSNPELGWEIQPVRVSFHQLMAELGKGTPVPEIAEKLSEQRFGQAKLLAELANYEDMVANGGWPLVLSDQLLKPGMVDAAVVILRRRLTIENYNIPPLQQGQAPQLYDRELAGVVRRFQANHGLKPDGEIGPTTQLALNLPAQLRRDQVLANLERLRWLPQELGANRVWVNIPAFRLQLVHAEKTKLDMGIIVGRKERPTPVFDDLISQVEVNPTWNVPTTIAFEDYLPALRKNPLYLKNKNIRVFADWKKGAKELDPRKVNWQAVNDKNRRWFPYRLTQDPGSNNALGRVKFLFPNRHNVYLHDTPERNLFSRVSRDFSSGCVRVEEPAALAEYLLSELMGTPANYSELRESKKTKRLFLDGSLPVYLTYFTAWVDDFGQLQFRDDIYGHDRPLLQMLDDLRASNPQARPAPPAVPRQAPSSLPPTILTASEGPLEKGSANKKPDAPTLKLKSAVALRTPAVKPPVSTARSAAQPDAAVKKPAVVENRPLKPELKPAQPVVQSQLVAAVVAENVAATNDSSTALNASAAQLDKGPQKTARNVTVVPLIGTNQLLLTNVVEQPLPPRKPLARSIIPPAENTATPVMVKTRSEPVLAQGEVVVIPVKQAVKMNPWVLSAKPLPDIPPTSQSDTLPATQPDTQTKMPNRSAKVQTAAASVKPPQKQQVQPLMKLNQSQVVIPASQSLSAVIKTKPAIQKTAEAPAISEEASPLAANTGSGRNKRRYGGPRSR